MISRQVFLVLFFGALCLSQVYGQSNQQQNQATGNNNNKPNQNNPNTNQGPDDTNVQQNTDFGPLQAMFNPFLNLLFFLSNGAFDFLKKGFQLPVDWLQTGQLSMANMLNSLQRPQLPFPTPRPFDLEQLYSILSQQQPSRSSSTPRPTQRPNNG